MNDLTVTARFGHNRDIHAGDWLPLPPNQSHRFIISLRYGATGILNKGDRLGSDGGTVVAVDCTMCMSTRCRQAKVPGPCGLAQ